MCYHSPVEVLLYRLGLEKAEVSRQTETNKNKRHAELTLKLLRRHGLLLPPRRLLLRLRRILEGVVELYRIAALSIGHGCCCGSGGLHLLLELGFPHLHFLSERA